MNSWDILRHAGFPQKVAAVDTDASLVSLFDLVENKLQDLITLSAKTPAVLVAARSKSDGLEDGRVWQSTVTKVLDEAGALLETIDELKYRLEDADLEDEANAKAAGQSANALFVPRKATVAFAISDIDFKDDQITYSLAVLKTWAGSLGEWAKNAKAVVTKLRRKAKT